jgi:heme-binding protein
VSRRLKQAAVVFVVAFAAAQFIRPERANPPIEANRTIQAHAGTSGALVAVLDRSCRDCHSNATVWPRAADLAPLSWLMAYAVRAGRQAVNFSDWTGYQPEQQRNLLAASCRDARQGKMPGSYTLVRPETRLSPQDIDIICAAAPQTEAHAGTGR